MKVADFSNVHDIKDTRQLESLLIKRYDYDANALWLYEGSEEYPSLSVLVKGQLAALHYLPSDGDAGYRSVGGGCNLQPGATSTFYIYCGEQIQVINDAVLPFSTACEAAKEYFNTKKLPSCVEWFRL